MKVKGTFNPEHNDARNFYGIEQAIVKLASGGSITEVIDKYMIDLQNYHNEDYEKKVPIDIGDVSDNLLKRLLDYLPAMRSRYEKIEREQAKRLQKESDTEKRQGIWIQIQEDIDNAVLDGKEGTEIEILERLIADIHAGNSHYELDNKGKIAAIKKLNSRLNSAKKKEKEEKEKQAKAREETTKKAEEAMKQIEEIVKREYEAGNIKNKVNYLATIRSAIIGENKNISLDIKLGQKAQEQLLQIIDDRIKTEKDEIYYEQVKDFTNNFQFLEQYSEIVSAINGATERKKFTDAESYDRYRGLISLLQKEKDDEYTRIQNIIKSGKIDGVDLRILTARLDVMREESERKNGENGEIR